MSAPAPHLRLTPDTAGTTPAAWLLDRATDVAVAARRRPRIALGVPLAGLVAGVAIALALPSRYPSSAAFVADSDAGRLQLSAGLAGLASQFGVSGSRSDPPQFYAEMLRNRTLVLPVLEKSYPARLLGRDRDMKLAEAMGVKDPGSPAGQEAALKEFNRLLDVSVNPRTGVVTFTVQARTPELAAAVANDLLQQLNDFNVRLRQTRAEAQLRFIQTRVDEAATALRDAEDDLRAFLSSNRVFQNSPNLQFEESRRRRSVELRQTLYVSLKQQLDQSAVEAARNTPALSVLTQPAMVTRRVFPKRRLVVASALAASLLLTLALLRWLERDQFGESMLSGAFARARERLARSS